LYILNIDHHSAFCIANVDSLRISQGIETRNLMMQDDHGDTFHV